MTLELLQLTEEDNDYLVFIIHTSSFLQQPVSHVDTALQTGRCQYRV